MKLQWYIWYTIAYPCYTADTSWWYIHMCVPTYLHESKLLEVALAVAKQLESLLPHDRHLRVVLRVKGHLYTVATSAQEERGDGNGVISICKQCPHPPHHCTPQTDKNLYLECFVGIRA